jgi:AraC-like DNA-binding protein
LRGVGETHCLTAARADGVVLSRNTLLPSAVKPSMSSDDPRLPAAALQGPDPDGAERDGAGTNSLAAASILDAIFNLTSDRGETLQADRLHIEAHRLGALTLVRTSGPPARFTRERTPARALHQDRILVQVIEEGRCRISVDGSGATCVAGDLAIHDLSRGVEIEASQGANIYVLVPCLLTHFNRNEIAELHGTIIRGRTGLGHVLGAHLTALARSAQSFDQAVADLAGEAARQVIVLTLRALDADRQASKMGRTEMPVGAIESFIQQNILRDELGPALICREFALSRSALYRLFEPLGGISGYIRARRLDRAYLNLTAVGSGRGSVARLARAAGFSNEASFTRAFRQRFGKTPRDAIAELAAAPTDKPNDM